LKVPEFVYLFPAAYLIGSIPTSYWIGRVFFRINLLEHGSKNVGATNAWRILGPPVGILVLVLDLLKGYLPVLYTISKFSHQSPIPVMIGITCVIGHSISPFLKFRGGKGVATSAGIFLALAPKALGICLGLFLIVVAITRYVSLGSMMAAITFPILSYIYYPQNPLIWQIGSGIALLILIRHRANLGRLLNGNENRLSFSKSKKL